MDASAKAMDVTALAAQHQEKYGKLAATYDGHVLFWRGRATLLEIVTAIAGVFLGIGGSVGFYEKIMSLDVPAGAGAAEYFWALTTFIPTLIGLVAALSTAYIGVVQPRWKEARYGASSAASNAMASVAATVASQDLSTTDVNDFKNALRAALSSLESSTTARLEPLGAPAEPKKAS